MIQLIGIIRLWPVALLIIAFMGGSFIVMVIRESYNEKQAKTGEDMNRLKEMLKEVVPDLENYVPAYGIWELEKYYGNCAQTYFWYYAIAFNDDRIHVIKLQNVKKRLEPEGSFVVEKSQDDKDHPVNIIQEEAAAAFEELVAKWTEDINRENNVKSTGIYGAMDKN